MTASGYTKLQGCRLKTPLALCRSGLIQSGYKASSDLRVKC